MKNNKIIKARDDYLFVMRARTSYGSRQLRALPGLNTTKSRTSQAPVNEEPIKPVNLHEIRLQILTMQEQTKKNRSIIARTTQKIDSNTTMINKTFEQSAEGPAGSSNHKNTIPMLKRSLEGSQSHLNDVEEQIEKAKVDDKYWIAKELEQEVAVAYIEMKRIQEDFANQKAVQNHFEAIFRDASAIQSSEHISQLRQAIRETKEANASYRDKLSAYQKKKAKIQIEFTLHDNKDSNKPSRQIIEEAEIEQAEDNQKLQQNCDQMRQMELDYQEKVNRLEEIINNQIQTIQQYMKDNEAELNKNIIEE